MKTIFVNCLLILLVSTGVGAPDPARNPTILTETDVPGFYLHQSQNILENMNPDPKAYPEFTQIPFHSEIWSTVPRKVWQDGIRGRGKIPPFQKIDVGVYSLRTREQAQKYAEVEFQPNRVPLPGSYAKWKPGAPSGRKVGNRSWYAAIDLPLPSNPPPTLVAAAKSLNQDTLWMIIVSGKSVFKIDVQGSIHKPIDRAWAEQIARVIADRL